MTFVEDITSVCLVLWCLFQVALAGSTVTYLVFAIIFLVKDYSVCGDTSPLWVFVLVSLVAPVFLNILRLQNQPVKNNNNAPETVSVIPFAAFLLLISEVVVGGILIYEDGRTCESMKHTGLWVVALILFWLQLLFALFLIIAMIIITFVSKLFGTLNNDTPVPVVQTGGVKNANSNSVLVVNAEENI